MEIKDRVKQIRNAKSLTQQKFAERLGMAKPSICSIEYGNSQMSDRTILNICKEFNVNEEWLRTGEGEMFKPQSKNEEIAEIVALLFKDAEDTEQIAKAKELLEIFIQLDDEAQEHMLWLARSLVRNK